MIVTLLGTIFREKELRMVRLKLKGQGHFILYFFARVRKFKPFWNENKEQSF